VGLESSGKQGRQRNRPDLLALGQGEDGLRADESHLPVDVDPAALEVDVLDGEAEDLSLAQTAAEGELASGLQTARQPGYDSSHALRRPGDPRPHPHRRHQGPRRGEPSAIGGRSLAGDGQQPSESRITEKRLCKNSYIN
jgi:hypothetical protein